MADIVNLRQARKARARSEKDEVAAANRVKFGRSKAEKQLATAKIELETRRLEGHRLGAVEAVPLAPTPPPTAASAPAAVTAPGGTPDHSPAVPGPVAPNPNRHG